ncbi:glycyl-tRNA synthetase 1 [Terfezia boudieri ATCC MYA-4762]|uniref:glycine--tRNA ligase n=1 Tax=Terfezia boudieri ATCC MYA-4762 TaxID=1051890 RepID=A0A3N4LMD5_9PEZI|nr:glycyl-tRNA synthetase 1 [Terfezia boudieri ATCC MYA-4762]
MATTLKGQPLDRPTLDTLCRRRLFYTPSFEIYGGISGFFDYGPPGCALQANIIDIWRKHFVLEEDMLEVDCTILTPHDVLKTSGHVDKFADWMCKDPKTGEIFRADHLVEEVIEARLKGDKEARLGEKKGAEGGVQETAKDVEENTSKEEKKRKKKVKNIMAVKLPDELVKEYESVLAKIDNYDGDELGDLIKKYDIRNPATGGELNPPLAFNLMFQTSIGPTGGVAGYLRPETAQGQFLNFSKLYEYNNLRMPFASASIGKSFRNEISPRQGLLRVREFLMAEIEHFVDPEDKAHPRFSEVFNVKLSFLPKGVQQSGSTEVIEKTIGEAVKEGMVDNETLGYFLARIQLFLLRIGIDKNKIRFRQHMNNEMAHYASDCWDAELFNSYGWIECVGCADRSAYDLSVHSKVTGQELIVRETLAEPVKKDEWEVDIEKKIFGPKFKKDAKIVEEALLALNQAQREAAAKTLQTEGVLGVSLPDGRSVEVDVTTVNITLRSKIINVREFTPNVIEPSFGIGRILYTLIEHSFWFRPEDVNRGVLSFPPSVAPTKVLLVPLSSNAQFTPIVNALSAKIRKVGISNKIDASSASIGKRYSRNDELGTPFGITVDFQTVKDGSVTLRERDGTRQVRGSQEEVVEVLRKLVEGEIGWEGTGLKEFVGQAVDDE